MDWDFRREIVARDPFGRVMARIGDDVKQCVVYLGYPKPGVDDEIEPEGTGFLLHLGEFAGGYLITAGHVARLLGKHPWGVRMNDMHGKGRVEHMDEVKWVYHPDPAVDLAAIPFDPPEWADCAFYEARLAITPEKIDEKDIGAGDLVYIVGVFHYLHGTKKNRPYVHPGHIAVLEDDELIPTHDPSTSKTTKVTGHLIAAQTLPGSSGSPVFVRRTIATVVPDRVNNGNLVKAKVSGALWLLGVWHGAWHGDPSKILALPPGSRIVPVGTGIVTPARHILELLNVDELKSEREAAQGVGESQRAATQQSSPKVAVASEAPKEEGVEQDSNSNPSHREDFTRLVNAAARKKQRAD